jgi:hypothetical protein
MSRRLGRRWRGSGGTLTYVSDVAEPRRALILLAVLVVRFAHAAAQERPAVLLPIEPGGRIRFVGSDVALSGTFLSCTRDTLYLELPDAAATVAVPLASLRSIAVHRGQRINGWRVAGYGVGGTLVGGRIGGLVAGPPEDDSWEGLGDLFNLLGGFAIGGTVVLLGGITLGLLHRSDRWEVVWLGGVLVGVAPRGHGIRVGARIGI